MKTGRAEAAPPTVRRIWGRRGPGSAGATGGLGEKSGVIARGRLVQYDPLLKQQWASGVEVTEPGPAVPCLFPPPTKAWCQGSPVAAAPTRGLPPWVAPTVKMPASSVTHGLSVGSTHGCMVLW